jgi:hypothetical protein
MCANSLFETSLTVAMRDVPASPQLTRAHVTAGLG